MFRRTQSNRQAVSGRIITHRLNFRRKHRTYARYFRERVHSAVTLVEPVLITRAFEKLEIIPEPTSLRTVP